MTIEEILILSAASLILGFIYRKTKWINLLMIASLGFVYWLQPETELRYLGYWLPSIAIAIMVTAWFSTTSPESRSHTKQLTTLGLILVLLIVIHSLRLIVPGWVLDIVAVPRLPGSIPAILAIFSLLVVAARYRTQTSPWLLWMVFGLLLVLFVVLKTPILAKQASQIWRTLSGQSPALASSAELSWLGFSYLAFRILHTIRDKQAGRLPDMALNEYLTYLVFFPAFVAGPIARADLFTTSLNNITDTFHEDLLTGSKRILSGLFKKFVLADSLSLIALNGQNALLPTSAGGGWILLFAFSLQIYFDFSGYTDIAIGLGRFFNIQLPENFNRPYLKPNLTQFWNNWHMTLTNWFRAYFFNPLSRTLRKKKTPAITILLITQVSTMVLVGLWHGVTINFVLWGLWHGLGLLIQNRWSGWFKGQFPPSDKDWIQQLRTSVGVILTFCYVTLGWIWFVLPTPRIAWGFIRILFGAAS